MNVGALGIGIVSNVSDVELSGGDGSRGGYKVSMRVKPDGTTHDVALRALQIRVTTLSGSVDAVPRSAHYGVIVGGRHLAVSSEVIASGGVLDFSKDRADLANVEPGDGREVELWFWAGGPTERKAEPPRCDGRDAGVLWLAAVPVAWLVLCLRLPVFTPGRCLGVAG